MMAIHVALLAALTDRRKSVLAANALYGATTTLLTQVLEPLGVAVNFVDICDLAALEQKIAETKPGCIVMETISNPLLRVGDLDRIAELARAGRRGAAGGQYLRDAAAGAAPGAWREFGRFTA